MSVGSHHDQHTCADMPATGTALLMGPDPSTGEQAATYQRLRAHMAYSNTDRGRGPVSRAGVGPHRGHSPTALLERLLEAEVNAT